MVKKIVALGDESLAAMELAIPSGAEDGTRCGSAKLFAESGGPGGFARGGAGTDYEGAGANAMEPQACGAELQISYKSLLYKLKQIGFEDSEVNQ